MDDYVFSICFQCFQYHFPIGPPTPTSTAIQEATTVTRMEAISAVAVGVNFCCITFVELTTYRYIFPHSSWSMLRFHCRTLQNPGAAGDCTLEQRKGHHERKWREMMVIIVNPNTAALIKAIAWASFMLAFFALRFGFLRSSSEVARHHRRAARSVPVAS